MHVRCIHFLKKYAICSQLSNYAKQWTNFCIFSSTPFNLVDLRLALLAVPVVAVVVASCCRISFLPFLPPSHLPSTGERRGTGRREGGSEGGRDGCCLYTFRTHVRMYAHFEPATETETVTPMEEEQQAQILRRRWVKEGKRRQEERQANNVAASSSSIESSEYIMEYSKGRRRRTGLSIKYVETQPTTHSTEESGSEQEERKVLHL